MLFSCAEDSETPTPLAELTVQVRQATPEGSTTASSILWVWPVPSADYTVANAFELLNNGWARDARNVPHNAQQQVERLTGVFTLQLEAGQYLIATMLSQAGQGRYSYTTVTVSANQPTTVEKVFTGSQSFEFETW